VAGVDAPRLLTRSPGGTSTKANRRIRSDLRQFRRDTSAVSPVIGTVLILFIVLLAMAGILAWGVPAIQGLQEHAEFQSMLTQMVQVNNDLLTLRDPQNTRLVTVSMNHGTLRVEDGSRWVVGVGRDETEFYLSNWERGGGDFDFHWGGAAVRVTADRVVGSTPQNIAAATQSSCSGSCTLAGTGAAAATYPVRVQAFDGNNLRAEAWVFDMGRVSYRMREDSNLNRVHVEMGAVFTQQGPRIFMEHSAAIKEPVYDITPADTSYLVRVFQLSGDSAVSGKGRHTILASLAENYGTTKFRAGGRRRGARNNGRHGGGVLQPPASHIHLLRIRRGCGRLRRGQHAVAVQSAQREQRRPVHVRDEPSGGERHCAQLLSAGSGATRAASRRS
jgi:hypothetical protein